jgi:hypothetical protein
MDFNTKVTGGSKDKNFDESPYIFLTANPKYVDVLCINCYECVRQVDVNRHSLVCRGLKPPANQTVNESSSSVNETKNFEKDVAALNEKLAKLSKALRIRLVEMESTELQPLLDLDLSEQQVTLSERYTTIYAYCNQILQNNDVKCYI